MVNAPNSLARRSEWSDMLPQPWKMSQRVTCRLAQRSKRALLQASIWPAESRMAARFMARPARPSERISSGGISDGR